MRPLARVALLAGAIACAGCGEDPPTGSGGLPDARGAFEGTWDVERLDLIAEDTVIETCGGAVEIAAQSEAGELSGTFLIRGAGGCAERSGGVEGEVDASGAVVLLLVVPGGSEIDFEDLTGCLFQLGGNAFGGELDGDELRAAATFLGDCEGVLSQVTMRFRGER